MPGLALPQGGGFLEKGQQFMGGAVNTYAGQRPKQEQTLNPPGKTAGGAVGSMAGMAIAGYSVGGPYGALGGAAVGLLSYYLS